MINKYDVHLHCMKVAKSCENFEHVKIAWQVLHRAVKMLGTKFRYKNSAFFFDIIQVLKGKERLYAERANEKNLEFKL